MPVAPATLTIDLGALAANWRLLHERAAPAECAAVVKADAYGIGIEPAVRTLWAAGCRTFFVAHVSEAKRVKAEAPAATVYVLNGLLPGSAASYLAPELHPVLGSLDEIAEWAAFCVAAGGPRPAAIHVDTGMNRLGLSAKELGELAAGPLIRDFEPALLMSHLVAAEDPADPISAKQIAAFEAARSILPGVPASLANCSGLFLPGRPVHDLARPGYALYGGNPTPGRPNPMRPVVRLEARIVQVREIGPGERVGYNGRWSAPSPRRLATISVGYADGYPRSAGGTDEAAAAGIDRGAALVGGTLCPFVGAVSMDLIVLDVTEAPAKAARRGGTAVLIGDALDLDEVGRRAGTIGYEILTGLGRRYERRYSPMA
ncbi:alanine racemase [Enterovirga sp. DB1703]|uniref:Alanine racemase n=1 Tax=Enterovirga aerilata TaxID=2730920 RepID=A0A849I3N2_9HYPH|nr:alanine racemase [Enterovirga sp. DB1703]